MVNYAPPYRGNRINYDHARQEINLKIRKAKGAPKGVKLSQFLENWNPWNDEFAPVPDRGYATYVERFQRQDFKFLCGQCDGRNSVLAQNIEAGVVCENYVNAMLDVVKERLAKQQAEKEAIDELALERAAAGEAASE
jgi:hypothetical protein